jgi:G6PDH family F420-dependent oxidoreductase
MIKLGYALSSEEHPPNDLVAFAVRAEELGFAFAGISDHFHPWVEDQGHSPFVWSVIGAIAARTTKLELGTGVTCPLIRIHPAIIAQAAATAEAMMPGRFTLGLGSGEALNEHITGSRWPPADVRHEMLEEAVTVIRGLWSGQTFNHHGRHYTVEDARIFDHLSDPVPIVVSAFGPQAAALAARCGDGIWATGLGKTFADYEHAGGRGQRWTQLTMCWARSRDEGVQTAFHYWRNTAVPGQLSQDLPTVFHFEQATSIVTKDMVADSVPCGPDPAPILESIEKARQAGADHIYLHQIGPDQDGFFDFYQSQLRPALQSGVGSGSR